MNLWLRLGWLIDFIHVLSSVLRISNYAPGVVCFVVVFIDILGSGGLADGSFLLIGCVTMKVYIRCNENWRERAPAEETLFCIYVCRTHISHIYNNFATHVCSSTLTHSIPCLSFFWAVVILLANSLIFISSLIYYISYSYYISIILLI